MVRLLVREGGPLPAGGDAVIDDITYIALGVTLLWFLFRRREQDEEWIRKNDKVITYTPRGVKK